VLLPLPLLLLLHSDLYARISTGLPIKSLTARTSLRQRLRHKAAKLESSGQRFHCPSNGAGEELGG